MTDRLPPDPPMKPDVDQTESVGKALQRQDGSVEPPSWPGTPERIYLQVCTEPNCGESFSWHQHEDDGLTWCADKINDTDVEYVRADIRSAESASACVDERSGAEVGARSDKPDVGALREALAELVALKDLQIEVDRLAQKIADDGDDMEVFRQWDEAKGDYDHRKPIAWERARAALNDHPAPD